MSDSIVSSDELIRPCADEPIHLSGSIQQHGFFLLLDEAFEHVVAASQNAERFLGVPLKLILGGRLTELFDREILFSLTRVSPQVTNPICTVRAEAKATFLGTFSVHGEAFAVISHCIGMRRVLEFEVQERLVSSELMNNVITNFVSTLGSLRSENEVCAALASQTAELTGFDRVMVYSFDKEGHGTVLAEVNNGLLPSCLGLHFPTTDIPAQARRLYLLSTVRIIPDANYTPSPLVGAPGLEAAELDLSLSTLRSVSPTHVEYMRNMGTYSSMSVSILVDGKLWGLVSGHHATPHTVPYLVRSACDMLTRLLSTQLNTFRTTSRLEQTLHLHAVQRNVLTLLAAEPDYLDGLLRELGHVQKIANASGVALLVDGHLSLHGETPTQENVKTLAGWLGERMADGDVFATANLGLEAGLDVNENLREHASGLIAVRISSVLDRYLMWFKPEIVRTVRWAGEPEKIVGQDRRLHPRNSFAEWKETVRGRAEAWTATEIESARDFRAALTTIGLRKAEEAIELGEARFQRLTESLPIKIFIADDNGRLTYTNDLWTRFGLLPSGYWFDDPSLAEADRTLCRQRWEKAVTGNSYFEVEVCATSVQQGERWNVVRAVPFQRAGAERAGWIGTFVDLTENREREAALRMNEKLALTGRMTSVIAHEINNPLEAITNLMYLLRNELGEDVDGSAANYISMVESELERISGITKQTLRWSRENSDRSQDFTGGTLADDVLRLFTGKIRNRQIELTVSGDLDTHFHGILGQIRQVLANLVSNAIDAAPIDGAVEVRLFGDGHTFGFAVSDNGEGIPQELRPRLFEPFVSTKGDLGNGLGLYISREIVERHHGSIHVDSSADGTRMTVEFPLTA